MATSRVPSIASPAPMKQGSLNLQPVPARGPTWRQPSLCSTDPGCSTAQLNKQNNIYCSELLMVCITRGCLTRCMLCDVTCDDAQAMLDLGLMASCACFACAPDAGRGIDAPWYCSTLVRVSRGMSSRVATPRLVNRAAKAALVGAYTVACEARCDGGFDGLGGPELVERGWRGEPLCIAAGFPGCGGQG